MQGVLYYFLHAVTMEASKTYLNGEPKREVAPSLREVKVLFLVVREGRRPPPVGGGFEMAREEWSTVGRELPKLENPVGVTGSTVLLSDTAGVLELSLVSPLSRSLSTS